MNPHHWEGFRDQVAELCDLLGKMDVDFVFLKTVKPYRHADSNVDVLLPRREHFLRVREALRQRGFRPAFTLEFDKAMLLPPRSQTRPWRPAAHLYRRISWYTVAYLDAEAVVRRARTASWEGLELPVPCPRDDLRIGALHAFFEQEALTLGDFWHLGARDGGAEAEAEEILDPQEVSSKAARWALRAVLTALDELSASLPPEDRTIRPQEEGRIVYRFPERTLLRGFALRAAEALHRLSVRELAAIIYAYGLIHTAKRLRWIRG